MSLQKELKTALKSSKAEADIRVLDKFKGKVSI